ncbi:filamentous hemagglutinin N-terminal domain-containing protein [Oxalobacteraceae bacterium OTU3CAMAD1]|nr:filamentous hemagglutinin N-terminal domain-containing protein [Oxalobacteraceae bacterium OTU3CAMAD1]
MRRISTGPTTSALRRRVLPLLLAAGFGAPQAAPVSPQVVAGQATFSQQGNVFSITNTPNTIINWQSFSVGAGEVTRFVQQSSSSAVLNRILGQDPSRIFGALQSNGRVFLINPNGVMFGRDSRVDVAGLVASSLNLSNSDFLAGRTNFTAVAGAGAVSNAGSIATPSGGQVYLVAPNVDNSGIITSPQGEVMLAAGHAVQLVEAGNPSVHVVVSAPDNAALNLGQVIAQGGRIGIYGALVAQRGRLNADSAVVGENGKIVLRASRDTLLEAGSVTSATGAGQGGEVAVLGRRVALTGDARIDASGQTGGGTVLVGGDYQGGNAAVQNAETTVVGAGANIRADAVARGDGGKIVVWADGATSMAGRLSARGGANGGDGGLAESSGMQFLDFRGTADLRAPRGRMGTLLLDPNDIAIAAGGDTYIGQNGGDPFVFEGINSPAMLTPLTITNQLGLSDVRVLTNTGSITVLSPVTWSNASGLTLSAATGITLNAQVTNTGGGKLALHTVGGDITQSAAISVPTLAAIADGGGVVLTHSGNSVGTLAGAGATGFSYRDSNALTIGTVSAGAIATQSGITSSGGDIGIVSGVGNLSGGLAIDAPVSALSGVVNLRDYKGNITQSASLNAAAALIIADEGAVTLNNTSNSLTELAGYSNAAAGFSFVNDSGFTVGTVAGSNGVLSFGAAPLTLTALTGDLSVSNTTYGVSAGSAGNSALSLTANGGQVLGGGIVKGATVAVSSATGINLNGTQNEIGALTASVAGSGDVALVNNRHLSIASISTGAANAAVNISTTAGSAFGIEVAGAIGTGATGSVSLNAGGSGAITRVGAASVISTNNLTLQSASGGAVGTSALPVLASAVGGGTTNFHTGTVGDGPQGLHLSQAGNLRLNAGSHYGNNTAVDIGATGNLTVAGNLSAGTADLTLESAGTIQMSGSYLIQAGALDLKAATGIYGSNSAAPLAIMSDSVQARNTTSGAVRLSNSGTNLSVGGAGSYGIDQQGSGNVYLDNASGYTTSIDKSVTSAGGSIAINGAGGIALAPSQTIASNGGGIQLFALGANAQLGIGSGSSVVSNGGLISLKADAMSLAGAVQAGSGGVAIAPGSGDTQIYAGAGAADVGGLAGVRVLGLTETELRTIDTSGYLYLGNGSQNADVIVSGALDLYDGGARSGMLSLNGGNGNVIINNVLTTGQATISNASASKAITIGNGGRLRSHGTTVLNTLGGLVLNGDGAIATNGAALYVEGTTGVALNGTSSISTAGGGLTLAAGSTDGMFATQAGTAISTGGAAATISADNMNLAGSITSASGVTLAPHSAGVAIKVGALAADSSGVLRLSSAELNGVHAPVLRIGSSTAGAIAIESALGNSGGGAFEHVDSTLKLASGGAITQSAGATIGGVDMLALAGASVTLDQANDTGRIAGSTSGAFSYRSANQISVETVDGSGGIAAGAGQTIRLKSDGAGISQGSGAPLIASGGTLVLEAAGAAELESSSNNFAILGGALNQGGAGAKGASQIHTGSNLSIASVTAMDGVTTLNGLSTNNQDLELSTGLSTYQLTVNQAIDAGTAGVTLETDNLALNDTVTANTVMLRPRTSGRPITVGSATCQVGGAGGCLAITRLDRVVAANIGIGQRYADSGAPGDLYVAGITSAGTAAATDINPATTLIALGSGGTITQGGPIVVDTLGLSAGGNVTLGHAGNLVSTLVAETNGKELSYNNSAGFTVGVLHANTLIEAGGSALSGIRTLGGDVALTVDGGPTGELTISRSINAGVGSVMLASSGAVYGDTGASDITAGTLSITADGTSTRSGGIGAIDGNGGLHTTVPRIAALWAPTGGIRIGSLTGLVVGPSTALADDFVRTGGTLALSTASGHALTINGNIAAVGDIELTAGSAGSGNALDQIHFERNVASSGGNITINANSVTGAHVPTGGNVISRLFVAPVPGSTPTLAECVANPALTGCAGVLPNLAACTANPALAGCGAVLPGLGACVAAPATAGCEAVLPTLAMCTVTPTLAGCSAVLPTVAACAASPGLPGCSVVLPTVAVCTATPTLPGCGAVLPTVAACTLTPGLPGCSAVLPGLAACVATPSLAGCAAVLPTLSACLTTPSTAGCSAILPTLAACIATPGAPGCAAVLPSLGICVATPNTAGCGAVLPTLAQCTSTPTLAGCGIVLPPVNICLVNPSAAGCQVVVPPSGLPSSGPVAQAINTTVNIINAVTTIGGSGGSAAFSSAPDDGDIKEKGGVKEGLAVQQTATKSELPKKTYCN